MNVPPSMNGPRLPAGARESDAARRRGGVPYENLAGNCWTIPEASVFAIIRISFSILS
jgi:hypothetical protein